ncbi:hypothetical protein H5410_018811, partial [Solanum commersonii]
TFSIATTSGRRITGSEREKAKSSSSSTPLATGEYAEDLGSGFSSDEESNYKKMYEDERDQRYKELGLRDKITLRSGYFLLGNKCLPVFLRSLSWWYCYAYLVTARQRMEGPCDEIWYDVKDTS